jgi:4-coumarate--CoA ligase
VKTGDIGYFNEDLSLMVVDRKKDIFKWKGYHVNPSEIEAQILTIEGVEQVSVVGVPDPEFQQLATAAVIRKIGYESLSEQEIVDHVTKNLTFYKHLHGGVQFMNEFPMTVSGKVQKRKVLELITSRSKSL